MKIIDYEGNDVIKMMEEINKQRWEESNLWGKIKYIYYNIYAKLYLKFDFILSKLTASRR